MVLEVVDVPSVTWHRTGPNPKATSHTADKRPGTAHVHEARGLEDDINRAAADILRRTAVDARVSNTNTASANVYIALDHRW